MKYFMQNKRKTNHLVPYFIWRIEDDEFSELISDSRIRSSVRVAIRAAVRDVLALVLLLTLWFVSISVFAGVDVERELNDEIVSYSSLWLKSDNGTASQGATTLATDITMTVSGPILRAKVRQKFRNTSQFWSEGVYTFPLPEQAAVDHLRMIIGGRIVEGQIHEKQAAQAIYQKAREAGKKTSLLSLHRTNIFTTAVANIGPGEEITVEFEYQQLLDFKRDRYVLRFPMVTTPQYTPARTNHDPTFFASNNAPIHKIRGVHDKSGNPVSITIDLKAGFPIEMPASSSHDINTEKLSDSHYKVILAGLADSSNRDFTLSWQIKPSDEPMVSVLREDVGEESYGLLMVMPPQSDLGIKNTMSRELVLVLDVSGSMTGESIQQARSAVLRAISQLGVDDYFNIIFFNTQAWSLFPSSQAAEFDTLNFARQTLHKQNANGGTDMRPALRMALSDSGSASLERLRQVIFITDGAVSNEAELFSEIRNKLGSSRLFTVGIGSAPNSYFMRKAARAGRGTFTYISSPKEVNHKINKLLGQLEAPALTDLRFYLNEPTAIVLPKILPDLYLGEPVYMVFKANNFPDFAELSGMLGITPSSLRVSLKSPIRHDGIAVEWGRKKITALQEQYRDLKKNNRELDDDVQQRVRKEIIDIAIAHHQVSKFTSLVAVDVIPQRAGGLLNSTRIPANRPKGWMTPVASKNNGIRLAQTATDARYNLLIGMVLMLSTICIWCLYLYLQRRFLWSRVY